MKKAIKASVMFVLTTAVGFLAMSIPFRLFEELTQTQMRSCSPRNARSAL